MIKDGIEIKDFNYIQPSKFEAQRKREKTIGKIIQFQINPEDSKIEWVYFTLHWVKIKEESKF